MAEQLTTAVAESWIRLAAQRIAEAADHLTELDSAIGDADHGTNMNRGLSAVVAKLDAGPAADTVQALLKSVGMTLISTVGGASGSLYGTFFLDMSKHEAAAGGLDAQGLAGAVRAGVDGVVRRGHAQIGDKTMIDALEPAAAALAAHAGEGSVAAARAAVEAARTGRDSTEPLVARKGRASYLGDRSAGHLDPGAASTTILLEALAEALEGDG